MKTVKLAVGFSNAQTIFTTFSLFVSTCGVALHHIASYHGGENNKFGHDGGDNEHDGRDGDGDCMGLKDPCPSSPLDFLPNESNNSQVLSKSYLAAFGEHLSSVIPALLDLAEACGGSGVTGETNARPAAVGPRDRYRSLQCLTTIAKLPYARVHPFKYQVNGFALAVLSGSW